jgi:hypothetical protein
LLSAVAVVAAAASVGALASRGGSRGGGSTGGKSRTRAQRNRSVVHGARKQGGRSLHRRRARTASAACPPAGHALDGVYHPERLRLIDPCRAVQGRVAIVRHEQDGDLHLDLALDRPYRSMLAAANFSQQSGDLVVELMPRDHGHLPAPAVGDRVALMGAFVDDTDHAWNELHPVWQLRIDGGRAHHSGPRFGGSPRAARSYNAISTCLTAAGRTCLGYGASPFSRAGTVGGPSGGGPAPAGDKDCSDFATQRAAQRYFLSKGGPARDPDRLDADHDGIACESLPR